MSGESNPGLLGVFPFLDDLLKALKQLKSSGIPVHTVFSPTPRHEIRDVLELKPSPVRFFTLLGGSLGVAGGVSLASYAHLQWEFVTGGKPVLAWIPFVVVGFEFTILFGVLFTLGSLLLKSRLPRLRLPDYYDPRFSGDRFGVFISGADDALHKTRKILLENGAEEVRDVP
jgi:molybdopterin-containing oxidoreductase family membrane subunit